MRLWSLDLNDVRDFDAKQCGALRRLLRQQVDRNGWKALGDCPPYVQPFVAALLRREDELRRLDRLF